MTKLILYKKKNIIANCGTVDYYKTIKVGELVFMDFDEASLIATQLLQQNLFDEVEQIELSITKKG